MFHGVLLRLVAVAESALCADLHNEQGRGYWSPLSVFTGDFLAIFVRLTSCLCIWCRWRVLVVQRLFPECAKGLGVVRHSAPAQVSL